MHWTVVDGFHTPHLVGGHVALDFCNTWAGWGEPPDPHREWVPDYDRLVTWAVWAGILDRAVGLRLRDRYAGRPEASGIVRQAHALRSTLYGYLTAAPRPAALPDVLLDTIRDARASQVLAPVGSGASWALPETIELPLRAIALAVADLFVEGGLDRIGRCPGNDCGWLFRSSQNRRWCSMATCGNRAKVRAHARRSREIQPSNLRRDRA